MGSAIAVSLFFLFSGKEALAAANLESSKVTSGIVVQGNALQSSKIAPGIVVQGDAVQASKMASGVIVQNSALSSAKISVGIVVQALPQPGTIQRAPLTHW